MLEIAQKVLPAGELEWQVVAAQHNILHPSPARDAESLKRKFMSLVKQKPPTGDPACPPDVRMAKRINREINNKVDIVTFQDMDNEYDASTRSTDQRDEDDDTVDSSSQSIGPASSWSNANPLKKTASPGSSTPAATSATNGK